MLSVVLAFVAAAPASAADPFPVRPFGPASPWNAVMPADAPLVPNSKGMVADLVRQVGEQVPWINTTKWSVPVYTVPADQPTVRVKVDVPGHDYAWNHTMFTNEADAAQLQAAFEAVPIPPDAHPTSGTDMSLLVWQPATDTAWEMWLTRKVPRDPLPWADPTPGWHMMWGARVEHVSTGSGVNPYPFGASASGLALFGGLVRIDELKAGRIDHAIGIAVQQPKLGEFVAPATRTDGFYNGPNAIPEGTRFRLDPNLDLDALDMPPVTRMIAEAAQRYGLIVRDTAGNVVVYGEDPTPTGTNPYPDLFEDLPPDRIMRAFPWDRLQVISPDAVPLLDPGPAPTPVTPKQEPGRGRPFVRESRRIQHVRDSHRRARHGHRRGHHRKAHRRHRHRAHRAHAPRRAHR